MGGLRDILSVNIVGTLATLNSDGSPWATPVHIFADDDSLYWFSKDIHQHSQNIENDPRVSVSLWAKIDRTKGGYISSAATKLSAEETSSALQIVEKTIGHIPPYFEGTYAYKLPIGQLDPKRSSSNRWYFYS
jgi:putative heme iron utilization protein